MIAIFIKTGWIDSEGAHYVSDVVLGFDDPNLGPTLTRLTVYESTHMGQLSTYILHLAKMKMLLQQGSFWKMQCKVKIAPRSESHDAPFQIHNTPDFSATVMKVGVPKGTHGFFQTGILR